MQILNAGIHDGMWPSCQNFVCGICCVFLPISGAVKCVVMKNLKSVGQQILMTFEQSGLCCDTRTQNPHHYFPLRVHFLYSNRAVIIDCWSYKSFWLDGLKLRSSNRLASPRVRFIYLTGRGGSITFHLHTHCPRTPYSISSLCQVWYTK